MDSLGGYRLVRRLGAGSRSEVWLGTDGSETAVIKVFREGAARQRIDAEIEALGRMSSRHVVRLDDLAMGPDGVPCLILQRLSPWNLGRVLAGARPRAGEAVTILAPLCLAVAELHRVGIAHGRIRGGSVLFDDAGAPVLASFGNAELFGPMPGDASGFSVSPAQLIRQTAVAADLDGLANLCRSMLDPESDIVHWVEDSRVRVVSTFGQELAERLFCFTAAEPVRFSMSTRGDAPTLIPSRVADVSAHTPGVDHVGASTGESSSNVSAATSSAARSISALMHLPDGMVDALFDGWNTIVVKRISEALRPVRKPVWIMAALVAIGVVVATAVLPLGDRGDVGSAEALAPSAMPEVVSSAVATAITGADPLAAASALLEARADCFDTRSVLCLDAVNQRGSAAMESDAAQVRLLQDGGAVDGSHFVDSGVKGEVAARRHIGIVEELGGSVLLSVTFGEPEAQGDSFSLLLINTDEGWRIRDFTPVTDSPY